MRIGKIGSIPVRVNPAAFVMAVLAIWAGEQQRLWVMSVSVLLHELMHIAAARLLHVPVIELELMPVGGAARLDGLWRLRPPQIIMVALAGPLANLLLMVLSAALCQWNIIPGKWAAMMIEQNLVIFTFNLLPALPLDGGRVVCGLFGRRMSPASAAQAGCRIGQITALLLLGISVYGLTKGTLNITLPLTAAFLLGSTRRERRQAGYAAMESFAARAEELQMERILPMRFLAVSEHTAVRDVIARFKPRYMHMVVVFDEQLTMKRMVSERELLGIMLKNEDAVMQNISCIVKNVNSQKE